MDYQAMFEALDSRPTEDEATRELLSQVLWELSPTARKRIAKRLEVSRQHFAPASAPGHVTWYPIKVAACALFQQMTR